MASPRSGPTPLDHVTVVLSPLLIMGLVGSLVFFLLEVCYRADGDYKGRMQWILFFYVFGAVLTARIALMVDIAARSGVYGLVLAFLTWLGLQLYVEYPEDGLRGVAWLVNGLLVGLAWWCTQRLTTDCTQVDEDAEPAGEGLLEAAGLGGAVVPPEPGPPPESKPGKQASTLGAWLERYRRYREERAKNRPLGVWVVYFSLAALPLFGLGQALIPAEDLGRRQSGFWLLSCYVGCGLGLLLTTCFLGLRRYLRQRRVQMPTSLAGLWLTSGLALVLGLLAVGALLPRPSSEFPLQGLVDPAGAAKRNASRLAVKTDGAGQGEGRAGQKAGPEGEPGAQGKNGKGGQGGEDGEGGKDGKGEKGGGQEKGNEGKGNAEKGGSDKGGSDKGKGDPGGQGKEKSDAAGNKGKNPDGGRGKSDRGDPDRGKDSREKGADRSGQPKDAKEKDRSGSSSTSRSSPGKFAGLSAALQRLGPVLKVVVFALLAVVVVVFVLRGALGFLAGFTDWARRLLDAWRRFWEGLFGWRTAREADDEGGDEGPAGAAPRVRAFAEFANPFESGAAEGMSPEELVRYTFEAVEAWGAGRGLPRLAGETPMEYAARVGDEVPALEDDLRGLAAFLGRALYARRAALPPGAVATARGCWEQLERPGRRAGAASPA